VAGQLRTSLSKSGSLQGGETRARGRKREGRKNEGKEKKKRKEKEKKRKEKKEKEKEKEKEKGNEKFQFFRKKFPHWHFPKTTNSSPKSKIPLNLHGLQTNLFNIFFLSTGRYIFVIFF
jgi:hypothetical protein